MAASTAPAVKANLLTQLEARAGLQGVGFNWSAPIDAALYARSGEDIYLGDVEQDEGWGALGGTMRRDEHYRLTVFVQVWREGNDPQGTEERCWELAAEIQTQLREDPQINGAIFRPSSEAPFAQFDGTGMSTRPADPQGWLSKATVRVAVGARI